MFTHLFCLNLLLSCSNYYYFFRCPTDLSVDILLKSHCGNQEDIDHYNMRFSFQLSEEFVNQHLYLHCRFTSCAMKDSKQLNIKQVCYFLFENLCLHVIFYDFIYSKFKLALAEEGSCPSLD